MKLPAGKYWIGDPCYVLKDGQFGFEWDKFCSLNYGVVDHQGIRFAHFGTACGDGSYQDQFGNNYGVDSGCMACIPAAFVREEDAGLGTFHQFYDDFDCEYYEGKIIIFGHVEIDTDPEDDDEDEYEYDDEYRRDDDEDDDDDHEHEEN